jgi:hypothetical protein
MCFFDPNTLELSLLTKAWLKHDLPSEINTDDSETIFTLINWLLEPCLNFVKEKCFQFISCTKIHLSFSFFNLYKCMLQDMMLSNLLFLFLDFDKFNFKILPFSNKYKEEQNEHSESLEEPYASVNKKKKETKSEMIVAYFMMSIVWSIGANLKQASRDIFSDFFNNLCRNIKTK